MKVKKEVWVEVCDFCGNKKVRVCCLCGKDICDKHSLTLTRERTPEEATGLMWVTPKIVLSCFCPDHLGLELTNKYNDSLSETKIKEENDV